MANVSSIVNSMKSLALASTAFLAVLVPSKNAVKSLALASTALVTGFSTSSCTTDTFQQDGRGGYTRTTYGVTPSDVIQGGMVVAGYALGNQYLSNSDRNSARYYNYANNSLRYSGGSWNRPVSGNRPGLSGGVGGGSGNYPSRPIYNSGHDNVFQCAQGGEIFIGNNPPHGLGGHGGRSGRSGGRMGN